jgi:transposase
MIVYVDETWVNVNHCVKGEWSECVLNDTSLMLGDARAEGSKYIPSGKGKRLIVLDAGCRDVGLLPDVGEVFVARNDTGDYHSEMNHEYFFGWWKNTLLPALPGPSTIVIDNASYHSVLTDDSRTPTTATKKDDIRLWLRDRRIDFTDDMLKGELLEIVRRNKPRPRYIIDELAMEAGHKVLRLPPRHCELNPIELVWAKMKGHVARHNYVPSC